MSTAILSHQHLPWTNVRSEQSLFRASLAGVSALFLFLALVVNFYTVPEPDRESLDVIPPQLAKLLKESNAKKVTPKQIEQPKPAEPKKADVVKPKPAPKVAPKPKPKAEPKQSVRKQRELKETNKSSAQQIEKAREVAKQSGILAMQSEMAALSSSVSSSGFSNESSSNRQTSANNVARTVNTVDKTALSATSTATASDSQALSKQEVALQAGAQEQLIVTSEEIALAKAERDANNTRKDEDVQIVVEGLRSTFNLLYNRALRDDPFLEGILELSIQIESNGTVSNVEVIQNTLDNDDFVAKLIARMKLTNFGASGNKMVKKVLPFEFSPS